jgi:hypothetical protein
MKLDDFIEATFYQIANGMKRAQEKCAGSGMRINPAGLSKRTTGEQLFWDDESGLYGQRIEFDLAVTTTDETTSKGKAELAVIGSSVDGGTEHLAGNSTIQRIRFSALVVFPSSESPKKINSLR